MAISKVDLSLKSILEDLDNGLTWLKKDDAGYGSIQEKYNAKDQQIAVIRKHPMLKDAETSLVIFNIIDDLTDQPNERTTTTVSASQPTADTPVERLPETDKANSITGENADFNSNGPDETGMGQAAPVTEAESADAFFNL